MIGAVIGAPVVDGTLDEFKAWISKWSAQPEVKGVRQVLHPQPHKTCLRADIVQKAKACGELDRPLVFELCMRADDLDAAAELAEACPQTSFVLDHCGGHHQLTAAAPPAMRRAWERGIQSLARRRNVFCKLSGLMGAQGGSDEGGAGVKAWSADVQRSSVSFCVEHFARDRLLFGGDWPVCTLSASLGEWAACCEEILDEAGWSHEDKAALARTAAECYRL